MKTSIKIAFLMLVLVQGLHSIEEYVGNLWEVFPLAVILTGLVSDNHETGFLIINIGLFIFGIWCWAVPVLRNHSVAGTLLWFWIIIEMINGIIHPFWALYEGTYVPGVATVPVLLVIAIYLIKGLKLFKRSAGMNV